MSYTIYDQSKERAAPIDMYEFRVGTELYRYTNAESGFGGYVAVPISRQSVKTTGKFEKTSIQIRTPVTTDLSKTFLPYPPPGVVRVTLRQKHQTDPEDQAMIVWQGRIISSGRENKESVLTVDNTLLSFKRQGLRRNFQHGCPLLFGGEFCRADLEPYKKSIAVREMVDGKIILEKEWADPWGHERFRGGTVSWLSELGRETRTIIKTTPDDFTVGGILRDVKIGTVMELTVGCRHDMADCRFYKGSQAEKNINNFGGQPWIPFKNPVVQHPFW